MALTRTEVLRESIQALAGGDPSALARLTGVVRTATASEEERENAEAERLRRALSLLLLLTRRNLRLLRAGDKAGSGSLGLLS
jgi:hypothetical protein